MIISALSNDIWLSKVCVFVVLVMAIREGWKQKSLINPYYLFSVTPLSLLAYFSVSEAYMKELSVETYFVAVVNMTSFLLTLNWTSGLSARNTTYIPRSLGSLRLAAVFFMVIAKLGSILPNLASVLWIFSLFGIVFALYTKERIMLLIVLVLFLVEATSVTSKLTMLFFALTFLISYERFFLTTKRQRTRIYIGVIVGLVFMFFAFIFANKDRGIYDAEGSLSYYMEQGISWNANIYFFMPYMYLTSAWSNLQYVIETQSQYTYGLWMLKPWLGYVQMSDLYSKHYELIPFSSFNTFTFVTVAYKDFGRYWSFMSSGFLGLFVGLMYRRYKASNYPYDTAVYIGVALATLQMFFSNHFYMLSYPFTIYLISIVLKKMVNPFVVKNNL